MRPTAELIIVSFLRETARAPTGTKQVSRGRNATEMRQTGSSDSADDWLGRRTWLVRLAMLQRERQALAKLIGIGRRLAESSRLMRPGLSKCRETQVRLVSEAA